MKKIIYFAILVVIFLLGGCTDASANSKEVVFYYVHNQTKFNSKSGVITPTTVHITPKNMDDRQILEKYFNGPTNYDCVSPFPAGIYLSDYEATNDKVTLVLSPHMGTINGIDFTIACACLTRTVIELTDVQTVQISIQGSLINGAESVSYSLSSFSYWDDTSLN